MLFTISPLFVILALYDSNKGDRTSTVNTAFLNIPLHLSMALARLLTNYNFLVAIHAILLI
jgi:hypothetical protein